MKVLGKDLFTLQSVNKGKPVLRPEVKEALDQIEKMMKEVGIDEVKL